jgi:hypothetical protein
MVVALRSNEPNRQMDGFFQHKSNKHSQVLRVSLENKLSAACSLAA